MSRFYASIQGERGRVTRQGHKEINGHIQGWNLGVSVRGYVAQNGSDVFDVFVTSGSNGTGRERFIVTVTEKDLAK